MKTMNSKWLASALIFGITTASQVGRSDNLIQSLKVAGSYTGTVNTRCQCEYPSYSTEVTLGNPDNYTNDDYLYSFESDGSKGWTSVYCNSPVKAGLNFNGLSADGTSLSIELSFESSLFSKVLSSGRDTIRMRENIRLTTCDGVAVNTNNFDPSEKLEDVISSFRALNFSRYMTCTLAADKVKWVDSYDENNQPIYSSRVSDAQGPTSEGTTFSEKDLTALDDGDVVVAGIRFSSTGSSHPEADQAASDAASQFVSLLKEYGNDLILLRDAKPADQEAAIESFFMKNKPLIIASLNTVDQNLNQTSILTKFNIVTSIQNGYNYVHFLEAKLANQLKTKFPLDKIIDVTVGN